MHHLRPRHRIKYLHFHRMQLRIRMDQRSHFDEHERERAVKLLQVRIKLLCIRCCSVHSGAYLIAMAAVDARCAGTDTATFAAAKKRGGSIREVQNKRIKNILMSVVH